MASTDTLIEPSRVTPSTTRTRRSYQKRATDVGRRAGRPHWADTASRRFDVHQMPDHSAASSPRPATAFRCATASSMIGLRASASGPGTAVGDGVLQVVEQRRVEPQHEPGGAERHHQQRYGGEHAEEGDRGGEVVATLLEVPLAGAGEVIEPLVPRTHARDAGAYAVAPGHDGVDDGEGHGSPAWSSGAAQPASPPPTGPARPAARIERTRRWVHLTYRTPRSLHGRPLPGRDGGHRPTENGAPGPVRRRGAGAC